MNKKIKSQAKREYLASCPDCHRERAAKKKSLTWKQVTKELNSIKFFVDLAFVYAYEDENVEASLGEAMKAYFELKELLNL